MGFVIVLLIIFTTYIIVLYNSLMSKIQKVEQAKSTIDVYLTQRFNLIPNLIECVDTHMEHERENFQKITEMRIEYLRSKDLNKGAKLNSECNKILSLAESYPELKASEQFLVLQRSLIKMEEQLQAARRIYNSQVTLYNTKINVIPLNILANLIGVKQVELFELDEEQKENIDIVK